jgi:hypothetical protein
MVEETAAVGFFAAVGAGFVAFWRALLGRPSEASVAADRGDARPYADQGQTSAG